MAAAINGVGTAFQVGQVQRLFEIQPRPTVFAYSGYAYDVSADGQRFLVNTMFEEPPSSEPITLLVNWPALLKR
jgi:hypothetical protein